MHKRTAGTKPDVQQTTIAHPYGEKRGILSIRSCGICWKQIPWKKVGEGVLVERTLSNVAGPYSAGTEGPRIIPTAGLFPRH